MYGNVVPTARRPWWRGELEPQHRIARRLVQPAARPGLMMLTLTTPAGLIDRHAQPHRALDLVLRFLG